MSLKFKHVITPVHTARVPLREQDIWHRYHAPFTIHTALTEGSAESYYPSNSSVSAVFSSTHDIQNCSTDSMHRR